MDCPVYIKIQLSEDQTKLVVIDSMLEHNHSVSKVRSIIANIISIKLLYH